MAAAAGPHGKVIGIDHDPAMRDTARQRTRTYPCVDATVALFRDYHSAETIRP